MSSPSLEKAKTLCDIQTLLTAFGIDSSSSTHVRVERGRERSPLDTDLPRLA